MLQVRDFKKKAKEGEMWEKSLRSRHRVHLNSPLKKNQKNNLSTSSWQNTDDEIAPSPDPLFPALVCSKTTRHPPVFPFLCMDMTYITCLLKDGFGFKEDTVLQVRPCQIRRLTSQTILLEYRFGFFFSLHLVEQEGEQCGVELGFGSHIGPFLQPEYPLR